MSSTDTESQPEIAWRALADSEMARRVREFDWARTPIGPAERWPQSLKTAVSLMLECQMPMYIAWGSAHTQIYNDAYRSILGKKHPAALGGAAPETWPEIWQTIGTMWQEVWKGKAVGFDGFRLTIERYGYSEDVYFNYSYSPVRTEAGEVGGVLVTFAETTQKVLSERRLKEEREKLHALFMQVPAAVAVIRGKDMRFELANKPYQKLVSRREQELVGRPLLSVFPELQHDLRQILVRVMAGERFTASEFPVALDWGGDGTVSQRFINFVYEPYRGDDGDAVDGFIAVAFDVTESVLARRQVEQAEAQTRAANEALQQADRRKDEFLATLAHELRNPLAPVRLAAEVLDLPNAGEGERHKSQQIIKRQVAHMAVLLDDLMDLSRITRGALALRLQRVSLAAVVQGAIETVRPLIEQRGQHLEVDLPEPDVEFRGDPLRLSQVFSNLLSNAVKYSEPSSAITLSARHAGSSVAVSVRDRGRGIAPHMLDKVFEMFVQETPRDGGLGVGLALVKGLVELHGGSVRVMSEGKEKGTEFIVTLPMRRAEAPASAAPAAAQAVSGPPRRVLIADDNQDAAHTLATLIRLSGHEVIVAHDGKEALQKLMEYRPHIAFLDIGMPRMDGYQVAREWRRQAAGPSIKLVALTGWGQAQDKRLAMESGFDEHLTKPVEPHLLLGLLA